MAKLTNLSTLPILFKSRNGVSSTIEPGVTLTLPDYEVVYDQVDSGVERGWLSVTKDDGSALFDSFGNIVGASPTPVSISSGDVTITGPITVANDVEIKNDAGNPIPVTGPLTESQLGTKVTASPALGMGGNGNIGWLSQLGDYLLALTGRFPASLGAKTAAQSLAVTMATDQSAILTTSAAKSFPQVAGSPFTLTASWQKVCTTTAATLGLRLGIPPNPSAYDIEWASVPAGAAAPTDAIGEAVMAGEDFASGLPIGDIFARSATLQKLIVKVA